MEATVLTRTFNVDYGCNGGRTAMFDQCLDLLKSKNLLKFVDLNSQFGGVVYYIDNDKNCWLLIAGVPTGRKDKVGSECYAHIVFKGNSSVDHKRMRNIACAAMRAVHDKKADQALVDAISIDNNAVSTFVPVEKLLEYSAPVDFADCVCTALSEYSAYCDTYMLYTSFPIMAEDVDAVKKAITIEGLVQTNGRVDMGIDPIYTEKPKGFFAKLFGRK